MFKILRDGINHSSHETYAEACQYARMEAAKEKSGEFIVYEVDTITSKPRYKAAFLDGRLSSYPLGVECVK